MAHSLVPHTKCTVPYSLPLLLLLLLLHTKERPLSFHMLWCGLLSRAREESQQPLSIVTNERNHSIKVIDKAGYMRWLKQTSTEVEQILYFSKKRKRKKNSVSKLTIKKHSIFENIEICLPLFYITVWTCINALQGITEIYTVLLFQLITTKNISRMSARRINLRIWYNIYCIK